MDILVLDDNFKAKGIFDGYESFIWTERYSTNGDFKIVCKSTADNRMLFQTFPPTYLRHLDSTRVMQVENVLDAVVEGKEQLTVSGRSLEASILKTRTVPPDWTSSGAVGAIMGSVARAVLMDGNGISALDVIQNFTIFNTTPTVAGGTPSVDVKIKMKPLYDALKELADSANLGFSMGLRTDGVNGLILRLFQGLERPDVRFSPLLDTLDNPSFLKSRELYRSIAYVHHKNGILTVPAPGFDVSVTGLARKTFPVDATDIDPTKYTTTAYNNMLKQRGLEALAVNWPTRFFDGEVPRNTNYRYGSDYKLGDIVTFVRSDDYKEKTRVTEYIWVSDAEGDRSYPTFTTTEN